MTVLYNHTNCCNLQALLVLLLVLPLTRDISNRQSLGSWNLLESFFHFLNQNNIHHFINSFGDFDDNEKKYPETAFSFFIANVLVYRAN